MNGIVAFLTLEVLFWSAFLIRHALWLQKHPYDEGYCDRISYRMLKVAAGMTGALSMCLAALWIWYKVNHGLGLSCFFVISSTQLAFIHLFSLLAHCTSLNRKYWPILSRVVSKQIVCRLKGDYKNDI